MNCPSCGSQVADGSSFCANCGATLAQQAQPVQQPASAQPGYAPGQPVQPGYAAPQQPVQQPGYQPAQPAAGAPAGAQKSKVAAGILGILLGSLGIHKFYLGYTKEGLIMLLVSIFGSIVTLGVAAFVMGVIGLVEGIMYLTKSDYDFYQTYELGQKTWF